ncbi:hypothetical protein Fmac_006347 [Flemingia macrophylla]|uniref:Uncharacterized protein n=1 Tax=Flemingia macrophylla TaxID=520843 RepID=A0ABD1NBI3_9FABA
MSKVGGDDFDVKSLLKGRARPKAIQAANAGLNVATLPRPSPQDRLPPVSEKKKKDKGTKKATTGPLKRSAEGEEVGEPSVHPEKKLKQTTIPEHAPSSGRRNIESLMGVPLLSPRVNAQELVAMDFTSAEGKKAIAELSLGDKLKAIGEMHLKGLALAQSLAKEPARELVTLRGRVNEAEKLTEEILAKNNELIDANKKVLAENASLKRQLEEVSTEAKNYATEREKAVSELGKLDKEFKDYRVRARIAARDQHEIGFKHAIQQAIRFCDLKGHDFDIRMDFYQGVYMSYDDMSEDAEPDEEVTPLAADGVEGDENTETQAEGTRVEDGAGEDDRDVEVTGPEDADVAGNAKETSFFENIRHSRLRFALLLSSHRFSSVSKRLFRWGGTCKDTPTLKSAYAGSREVENRFVIVGEKKFVNSLELGWRIFGGSYSDVGQKNMLAKLLMIPMPVPIASILPFNLSSNRRESSSVTGTVGFRFCHCESIDSKGFKVFPESVSCMISIKECTTVYRPLQLMLIRNP